MVICMNKWGKGLTWCWWVPISFYHCLSCPQGFLGSSTSYCSSLPVISAPPHHKPDKAVHTHNNNSVVKIIYRHTVIPHTVFHTNLNYFSVNEMSSIYKYCLLITLGHKQRKSRNKKQHYMYTILNLSMPSKLTYISKPYLWKDINLGYLRTDGTN